MKKYYLSIVRLHTPQKLTQNGHRPKLEKKRQYCKTFRTKAVEILRDLGFGNEFLHTIPKAWQMKESNNELDYTKI